MLITLAWRKFQSTLPRGERHCPDLLSAVVQSFNPRSRAGSDVLRGRSRRRNDTFQSTLPRGERRVSRYTPQIGTYCFNPRSRAGSDVDAPSYDADAKVSIHAPARGATCCRSFCRSLQISFNPRSRAGSDVTHCNLFKDSIVSIHAPARGATPGVTDTTVVIEFQSTLPRGERRYLHALIGAVALVSIHAPARGATGIHRPYDPHK